MSINRLFWFTDGIANHRYNDGKAAVVYDSETYAPAAIRMSGLEDTLDDNEFKVSMRLDNPPASLFLSSHPAAKWLAIVMKTDGTIITRGIIMAVEYEIENRIAVLSCSGGGAYRDSDIPQDVASRTCQNELFDSDCRLLSTDFEEVIQVNDLDIDGDVIVDESGTVDGYPDGYFSWGYIAAGNTFATIGKHVGDTLHLLTPLVLGTATEISVFPGCNKTVDNCSSKFGPSNLVNFRGIPHSPAYNPTTDGVITR